MTTTAPRWINPTSIETCHANNRARTEHAAQHKVPAARKALRVLHKYEGHPATKKWPGRHRNYLRALQARIDHPHASLTEIADRLGVNKDVYSSQLRRALAYAQTLEANA